tara:strand:- start:28 stop:429 length:402 start_codon:yes stop_codon:yes gene_type:complete
MRHRKAGRKLNRNSSHRSSMMRNLAISIILYESVKTTLAKAKEVRSFLEPLITLSKDNNVSNQRRAFSKLRHKQAVAKLFNELGPRNKDRPGGYLRIIKRGFRQGDKAPIAQIELVQLKEQEDLESTAEVVEN